MSHNPHTFAAAYVILIQDEKVLLARRYNTGFEDGNYSLPAGHTEPEETFTQTLIRETSEEIGITLTKEQIRVSHVMHRNSQHGRVYVDIYYVSTDWDGTPKNMEQTKCDDLSWFPIDNLPENTIPYVRQAIEHSVNKVFYSEYGWND